MLKVLKTEFQWWVGLVMIFLAYPGISNAAPHPYIQPTPEQARQAIADARQQAREIGEKLDLNLSEVETDHCLIFTDWDRREFDFLKVNLEGAYAAISQQFGLSSRKNIFVGRLPVYMLKDQKEFQRFAKEIDGYSASKQVAGYYYGRTDGIGHLVMWKPKVDGSDVAQAKRDWGYVLAHEFTHAFVARYRTNAPVPTWINEGLAEVVASSQFPRPAALDQARAMAERHKSIDWIFKAQHPAAPWYPVMQTLVQTLLNRSRPDFLKMFDEIKQGASAPAALKKAYGWNETDLQRAWRQYLFQGGR